MKPLILSLLIAPSALVNAATVVFDNQFNGTWSGVDNGTPFGPVATRNLDTVGSTFTNDGDANGAVWTVDIMTPAPWNYGGVIFTGAEVTTGQISTSFNTILGATYTVFWGVDQNPGGWNTSTDLKASAGGQEQILGTGQDGSFSFTGDGNLMTLVIGVNSVGSFNSESDVQVDYVRVEYIPEPSAALLGGLSLLGLLRRRR